MERQAPCRLGRHAPTLLLLLIVALFAAASAVRLTPGTDSHPTLRTDEEQLEKKKHHKKKKPKHPFTSPVGFFIQERASKQLPGPGQHFQFGALQSWDNILATVKNTPDAKLLLLIRHGQALSNWLQDTLGPDEWFGVETKCSYTDKNGTTYDIFDAALTDLGIEQGKYLNTILNGGGWWARMTGGLPVRAIVSPLTRCIQTTRLVSQDLNIQTFSVEENVRETLGEDTCDARRSASDPDAATLLQHAPCSFEDGLRSAYPDFEFPVRGEDEYTGFGLVSDADKLWTKDRETQKNQVKRATRFLTDLWEYAEEQVVVVFTHSGFTRSVLLAAGREPYRPQNTELVPAIIMRNVREPGDSDTEEEYEE